MGILCLPETSPKELDQCLEVGALLHPHILVVVDSLHLVGSPFVLGVDSLEMDSLVVDYNQLVGCTQVAGCSLPFVGCSHNSDLAVGV